MVILARVKIYTRRGDGGETDLFAGGRVSKDALRVEAYGSVDELNSTMGVAAAATSHDDVRELCRTIQGTLFDLGAYLATPDEARRKAKRVPQATDEDVDALEAAIDHHEEGLAPLQRFILPGGTEAAAAFHLARTVCRRAERRCVTLHGSEPLEPAPLRYLNRLSDLLFVLARVENQRAGVPDVEWAGRS